jgi:hypothetical protein
VAQRHLAPRNFPSTSDQLRRLQRQLNELLDGPADAGAPDPNPDPNVTRAQTLEANRLDAARNSRIY